MIRDQEYRDVEGGIGEVCGLPSGESDDIPIGTSTNRRFSSSIIEDSNYGIIGADKEGYKGLQRDFKAV